MSIDCNRVNEKGNKETEQMAKIQHTSVGYLYFIIHSSLLFMWHHFQSLNAIGVLGYPITIFMENGQAQYKWMNDFDYLTQSPKDGIMLTANGRKI